MMYHADFKLLAFLQFMTEMKETAFIMQNVSQRYVWIQLALSAIFIVSDSGDFNS